MFATQLLLWLASQLMKPSRCYLWVLSLRNEYLITVCETYRSGWVRLLIQWHFCTLTEPITWSVGYGDKFWLLFLLNFRFITLHHHHHDQGISWAKRRYHDNEETLNKCRQLQKVQTQTGRSGSPPRANEEESQRAFKMAPQSIHNGGVAGGGNCFFWGLSFLLFCTDLPCENGVPNKMCKKQYYDYKNL